MSFTRRQVYAGNGNLRRVRKSDPLTAPLVITNAERERFVATTFTDAVKAVLADPNVQFSHLVRLLQSPSPDPVTIIDNFPWPLFERTFREAEKVLVEQLIDGGQAASAELFTNFYSRDPNVLIWGARHAAEMVTSITEDQRRLLRNHVMNSHLSGLAPRQLAREIREIIGLTPQHQAAVVKFHRNLTAKGTDEAFAAKQSAKYAARLVTSRASTIARTEVMRAENEGKVLGWQQAIANGFLPADGKKRWHTAITNVCPICLPMDGAEVDLDSTFRVSNQSGRSWAVRTPPAHPNCRCTLTYVPISAREIAAEAGLDFDTILSEIKPGTYQPEQWVDPFGDPAPDPDSLEVETPDLQVVSPPSPALSPDTTPVPTPPTFTRRGEAQAWAARHLTPRMSGPRHIDLEDLALPAVQELLDASAHYANTYPRAFATLERLGTLQAIYRAVPGYPRQIGGNTWAQTTHDNTSLAATLGLSKTWFTKAGLTRYLKAYAKTVTDRWHPPTPDATAVRGTLDHEFAHILTYFIGNQDGGTLTSLIPYLSSYTGYPESFWDLDRSVCQNYIRAQISEYAVSSWHEFIAEAFTYGINHPNPPPLAQAVLAWVRDRAA